MKTKIYACYGILGHEKEIVYSVTPTDICDEITVEIPESVKPYVTVTGSIAVVVPFFTGDTVFPCALEEVLYTGADGEPTLKAFGWYYKLKRIVEGE